MAAGLPIVAFDCPWGPGDILRDDQDGLLVPPEDVDALGAAMRRLILDAGLRARLGEAATRSVRRFAREAIVAHWDALVAEATGAGEPARLGERPLDEPRASTTPAA
jgi:glycosyltransferase involved in cell wall biosynthesis